MLIWIYLNSEVFPLKDLEDELLLEAYQKAVKYNLSQNFIDMLWNEIRNRGIKEAYHHDNRFS